MYISRPLFLSLPALQELRREFEKDKERIAAMKKVRKFKAA